MSGGKRHSQLYRSALLSTDGSTADTLRWSPADVRLLMGISHAGTRGVGNIGATIQTISARRIRSCAGFPAASRSVSAHVAAVSGHKQDVIVRLGMLNGWTAIRPCGSGVTIIDDPYTKA